MYLELAPHIILNIPFNPDISFLLMIHINNTTKNLPFTHEIAGSSFGNLERETGFEPATNSLEGCDSSQLSYSRLL